MRSSSRCSSSGSPPSSSPSGCASAARPARRMMRTANPRGAGRQTAPSHNEGNGSSPTREVFDGVRDCRGDCRPERHSCDALPRPRRAPVQAFALAPVDVLTRWRIDSRPEPTRTKRRIHSWLVDGTSEARSPAVVAFRRMAELRSLRAGVRLGRCCVSTRTAPPPLSATARCGRDQPSARNLLVNSAAHL